MRKVRAKVRNNDIYQARMSTEFGDLIFEPIINSETGEITSIALFVECPDCGEFYLHNIYTNGSIASEVIAQSMGLRD